MSLRLYLDEHVPVDLAPLLRSHGIDALTAQEAVLANRKISDEDQLNFSTSEGRAILTFNARDFAPIASRWAESGREHAGIILSPERHAWELVPGILQVVADHPDGLASLLIWL